MEKVYDFVNNNVIKPLQDAWNWISSGFGNFEGYGSFESYDGMTDLEGRAIDIVGNLR